MQHSPVGSAGLRQTWSEKRAARSRIRFRTHTELRDSFVCSDLDRVRDGNTGGEPTERERDETRENDVARGDATRYPHHRGRSATDSTNSFARAATVHRVGRFAVKCASFSVIPPLRRRRSPVPVNLSLTRPHTIIHSAARRQDKRASTARCNLQFYNFASAIIVPPSITCSDRVSKERARGERPNLSRARYRVIAPSEQNAFMIHARSRAGSTTYRRLTIVRVVTILPIVFPCASTHAWTYVCT